MAVNKAALEELSAAQYITNYFDFTQNTPDELQRFVTKMWECDLDCRQMLQQIDTEKKAFELLQDSESKQRSIAKIRELAEKCAESVEQKSQLMIQMNKCLESRIKTLDQFEEELDNTKSGMNGEPAPQTTDMKAEPENRLLSSKSDTKIKEEPKLTSKKDFKAPKPANRARRQTESSAASGTPGKLRMLPKKPAIVSSSNGISSGIPVKKSKVASKTQKKTSKQPVTTTTTEESESSSDDDDDSKTTYCVCRKKAEGEMVACDWKSCKIEWFHFSCVNLTATPKGKWYCMDCRGDRLGKIPIAVVPEKKPASTSSTRGKKV